MCVIYRAQQVPGNRKGYYVGKYEVLLNSFEQVALPTFSCPNDKSDKTQWTKHLQVIDEIGKMELYSKDFVQSVQRMFRSPHSVVLATIPISKGKSHWLLEELRSRKDVQLFEVSMLAATPSLIFPPHKASIGFVFAINLMITYEYHIIMHTHSVGLTHY